MEPTEITQFCDHLQRRNYSPHTIENYGRDLRLFFALAGEPPRAVTWHTVDHFIQPQHRAALTAATINRRLKAVKHFFDYLETISINL